MTGLGGLLVRRVASGFKGVSRLFSTTKSHFFLNRKAQSLFVPYKDRQKRLDYNRRYNKQHYVENAEKYRNKAAVRRRQLREKYNAHKAQEVCTDCGLEGKDNVWLMEYDHINPSDKKRTVSRMVADGYAWKTILAEIKKCEPVCSNCHRRREFNRFNENPDSWSRKNQHPTAFKDNQRRRNTAKRVKRKKLAKEREKGQHKVGPDPKPLRSIVLEDIEREYEEE